MIPPFLVQSPLKMSANAKPSLLGTVTAERVSVRETVLSWFGIATPLLLLWPHQCLPQCQMLRV